MEGFFMYKGKNIKLTTDSLTFQKAYNEFQTHNKARNLAPATIKNYEVFKRLFAEFMGDNDFPLDSITPNIIKKYIQHLDNKGNSPIAINTKLRHLRAAINYFADCEYMDRIPVKLIKAEKPVKETYTDTELALLLKKPNLRKAGFDDYRNWVLVNYLLATGNRLSSVINIRISDLNLDEDEIILRHTKNKSQQIIPIASALKPILLEYLRYRKPSSPEDYLFCTWHGKQLSVNGIGIAIQRYNRRRGVNKTSVHLFRHTYAKKWIMAGGDILRLQKLLGHKSLDMVKEYVTMFNADIKKDYDKFNPLSNMVQTKKHIKL